MAAAEGGEVGRRGTEDTVGKGRENRERDREGSFADTPVYLHVGNVICTQARRGKEIDWMESWPGPFSRISSIGIPTIFIHSC